MRKNSLLRTFFCFFTAIVCMFSFSAVYADTSIFNEKNAIDYMALVNKQHKLPDDWEENVQLVKAKSASGDVVSVEKETLKSFCKLQKDLLEEGIDIELDSVYRSVSEQQELWDSWVVEYGLDYVQKYVAVPGFSEHHTGLAVDVCLVKDGKIIDDNDDMIAEKEIFSKVHEKLPEYGFILRYLEGKDDITGYSYEPWHLRYIGNVAVAKYIQENSITLEEYLETIRYKGMPSSPDWVVKLAEEKGTSQIFVVGAVGKSTAYISMHEKTPSGKWRQIISTPGFIGKNGLGKEKEGDGKTPIGTYKFNYAFGIADDPGCALKYEKVTQNNYWSGDVKYKYNQMVNIDEYKDLNVADSEHLIDYRYEYQYALNISYNEDCVPGAGSAIFLHCFGKAKPHTGGCVAIPRDRMKKVMKYLKPDCIIVIDELKTLSPETWAEWKM